MPRIITEYKEEVKKRIIEVAYSLFLEKGFHATTMDDIAKGLGVTKPALYQYFPGKEGLYAAVAERARQDFNAILERSFACQDISGGSGALFDALVSSVPFNGIYAEMLLLAEYNESIRSVLQQDCMGEIEIIERFIARLQETGRVPAQLNSRTLALTCRALAYGLLMDVMKGIDRNEARKIWVAALEKLVRAD